MLEEFLHCKFCKFITCCIAVVDDRSNRVVLFTHPVIFSVLCFRITFFFFSVLTLLLLLFLS